MLATGIAERDIESVAQIAHTNRCMSEPYEIEKSQAQRRRPELRRCAPARRAEAGSHP
jgi:hypothetical protein